MNDIIFSNSFIFRTLKFNKFNYTDNRGGSPSHYLAYMISGRCKISTSSETVEIKEGDIFYIPNKCSYQSYWYGEPKIKFISLGFSFMPNFNNKTYPVQVIEKSEEAVSLFFDIAASHPTNAADIGKFYTLTALLLPHMKDTKISRTDEIVNKTKSYLITHPFADAKELAKNCAISEAALYSAFQKSSAITPNELKGELLLEKAKELLISTDKSVEYISDLLKFSSSSYFRKKFKNYFGITPRDMRKRNQI